MSSNAPSKASTPSADSVSSTKSASPESYTEYSLRSCTKDEIEGIRHHVIKFQSRNKVDPATQFDQPVRLHRKDPRNLQFQLTRREIEERKRERDAKINKLKERQLQRMLQRQEDEANGMTLEDSMDLDDDIAEGDSDLDEVAKQLRAEEERKRKKFTAASTKPSTDMTIVAPDGGARNQKKNLFKKKTRQVNVVDEAKRKLRYEEYYPWVMEDYDGKNTWVGSYEAGSSDSYVVFVFDNDGFKMIPLEKVYKFTPRNKYATLTLEEAESRMQKNSQVPRWLMKHMADENKEAGALDPRFRKNASNNRKLKTVTGSRGGEEEGGRGSDNEDIDFDDEFADDEEAPIMEDEEQNRDSERRMKREMLSANALGIERQYDDEDEEEDEEFADLFGSKKAEDKDIKKLRKTLVKSEMNDAYDTDDEENPYLSHSEEDEDTEVKVKKEDETGEDSLKVKQEDEDRIPSKRSQSPSLPRQVFVTSIKHLFIKIKAPTKTLQSFPPGEWNPKSLKRKIETDDEDEPTAEETPSKKIKLEDLHIKSENGTPASSNNAKSPVSRTHTPAEDDLLTEDDIKKVVHNGPIKITDLLSGLRKKIHRHPENKNRVKFLVKKFLRQQNGLLYLKDQNNSN